MNKKSLTQRETEIPSNLKSLLLLLILILYFYYYHLMYCTLKIQDCTAAAIGDKKKDIPASIPEPLEAATHNWSVKPCEKI